MTKKKTYPPFICDPTHHYLFTDGSCYPNPNGAGGWAFIHVYGGRILAFDSGGFYPASTSEAELLAIEYAVTYGLKVCPELRFTIVTDSAYCCYGYQNYFRRAAKNNWITSQGKYLAHQPIIARTLALWLPKKFNIAKVKGHSGNTWNDTVDELAGYERREVADNIGLYPLIKP